jgi:ketosteroid isomerase-like protein
MAEDMEQAKERIRLGYEAFNRGDFDESAKHIHPDVDWHRVADVEQRLEGRDAVRSNMEPEVWGKQRVEVHSMELLGDSVLVDVTFRAVGAGSGIEIDQRGYHVWKMRDGMGARFQFFTDRDEAVKVVREQEGLSD